MRSREVKMKVVVGGEGEGDKGLVAGGGEGEDGGRGWR